MNVLYTKNDIEVVRWATIEKLKAIAMAHPLRRSRLCLHHHLADPTHEMIIVAHVSTDIRPHRHPRNKSESYHVIEGAMDVRIFDDTGRIERILHLAATPGAAMMYRVTNGWWHQPVPKTEWVVYHETYTGPFDKRLDVEYAPWDGDVGHAAAGDTR